MDSSEFYKQSTLPHLVQPDAVEIPIPDKIGPYKIETLLSKGGMSLLYLGLHPETQKTLVVKVLSPHLVQEHDVIEQFLKEAEIIALTNHPNIVKLYGQGEWENGLYIAMEFIQGVSLKQFILQNSLSNKRSLEILLQVAYALLHLHTHGVIHRDLKPENILITEDGGVKVIDFGIAQLDQEDSSLTKITRGGLIGTPSYMSPEQKKAPSKASYASDIYALGIVSYELLIGKLSFGKIQLSLLPSLLQPIIQKAIAKDLKQRYKEIVEYITDISTFLKSNTRQNAIISSENQYLYDSLERMQKSFILEEIPKWPDIEVGIAKSKGPFSLDLYYDMIKLADGNYLITLAETKTIEMDSITHLAILRGMLRSLIYKPAHSTTEILQIRSLVFELNNLLVEDPIDLQFSFAIVHFDISENTFMAINCGLHSIWHLPLSSEYPRSLTSDNPLLGKTPQVEFYENVDNWNQGDTLILHSFNAETNTAKTVNNLDESIKHSLSENLELSSKAQSENLLDTLLNMHSYEDEQHSHIVITLESLT
ncbi:serine/threonine protein kinase [Candidatus Aerophobetes bacterium]|uniref:Serine/threonine protein kinase n=1 Tax=Aerophobetes bacterium TaxID=2030807 RepID=A0A2A4YMV2_UNCAE|nr:MAG: serine/threonine protein kinase [Candidatus Aerophobetes bacterium]